MGYRAYLEHIERCFRAGVEASRYSGSFYRKASLADAAAELIDAVPEGGEDGEDVLGEGGED
jgi:hypothetical protein